MTSWDHKASPPETQRAQRAAAVSPRSPRHPLSNGAIALGDALDIATAELEQLIARHFAARRTLVVSNDEGKFWTAAIGDDVLYRSPDGAATLRFANTFAERTPGVDVEVEPATEWSVRVDNVVAIR